MPEYRVLGELLERWDDSGACGGLEMARGDKALGESQEHRGGVWVQAAGLRKGGLEI